MHVKLKWVLRDKSRHGKRRYYFRKPGQKMIRLPDDPSTSEFLAAYNLALSGKVKPKAPRNSVTYVDKTSLRWLTERYYASADFRRLGKRTQHVRRLILEGMLTKHGDKPYKLLEPKHIRALRDEKIEAPEAGNARVKALRQVFRFAIENDHHNRNPADDVSYFSKEGEGFHAWTLDEVETFEKRHPIGTKARLALALLLYTGQRRSDVVLMGRQHVRDGWLTMTQTKNRRKQPVVISIPIVPQLEKVIAASPCGDITFLVTAFGKGFTPAGFGNWFRDRCDEAGLKHCSAHGLRKATASRLAELGCSTQEIMAITGHTTLKEVERYTAAARRKILAESAMAKFSAEE